MNIGNKVMSVSLLLNALVVTLFVILAFKQCGHPPTSLIFRTDTVTKIVRIHDTVPGKPQLISSKPDTFWKTQKEYLPDTNYKTLLKQYLRIGNEFFTGHIFETIFPIRTYGTIKVQDSITMNKLISSIIIQDLHIPETTITSTITAPPVRQLYIGGSLLGNPTTLINGALVGVLYKDRKDRMFGAGVGWNGQVQYSISSYWKIKIK